MDCINLKERFGELFKVDYEESYYAEHGGNAYKPDPWYMILLCQNGHICPWGGTELAACTKNAGPIAAKLKRLPFSRVGQEGDDGANIVFDVEHFAEVAEIMRPRKRRRRVLTAEQRAELQDRMQRINRARQSRSSSEAETGLPAA